MASSLAMTGERERKKRGGKEAISGISLGIYLAAGSDQRGVFSILNEICYEVSKQED
jgi:hypothetical protein